MDTILLPTIDANANLSDAVDALKKSDSAALLTEVPSGFKVIDVDLILSALRSRGNVRVKMLKPRFRCMRLEGDKPAAKLIDRERLAVQDLLDKQSAAYAVTRFVRGKAELLTRHESYRYLLGGQPDMWRCVQNPNHVWLTIDLVQPGDLCSYDGSGVVQV